MNKSEFLNSLEEKLKVTPIAPPTAATAAVAKKPADDLFADDDESDL